MFATAPPGERTARLHWLIRLRWLALAGVSLAAGCAAAGLVPGVNLDVVALAVALGVVTNVVLAWRWQRRGETDDRHVGQAVLDTGALTLVLWAAGGAECPFIAFYVFPVLLAALLGGRAALLPTGAATAVGLAFLLAATRIPALRVGHWNPPAPYDHLLAAGAIVLTVAMAAYFAARLTDALRSQMQARREADAILRVAFEGLAAGLEVVDRGKVVAQNLQAERLFGARAGDRWRCPGHRGPACAASDIDCGARPERCQFAVHAPTEPERIFEMLAFPLPGNDRVMALYVDRTSEVLSQRQLMLTERLASLGRTVQGVAHELNTPLATILTLGRDVNDALAEAELPDAVRDDVTESTGMIISEVQRCRRITHALLGRAEHFDARTGGADASVAQAMDRAVAVVFTQDRAQVEVQLGPIAEARFPLDPLVQIFVNLLQNARDAAPEAPIVVRGRQEGGLAVEIEDHGPGLPPEAERHLFEPFFTTKPPGRGTGLGLYTSYALARGLRAELTLRNRPEGGAVATLRLPGSLSDPSTSAAASA